MSCQLTVRKPGDAAGREVEVAASGGCCANVVGHSVQRVQVYVHLVVARDKVAVIGGGNGMLPETDLHVMRVYTDATFRGFVDMRGDVTIGNNFNDDRLEIWSSTVVNNFAIQVR